MKAEITMSQLWMNPEVMNFFMRRQAQEELTDLLDFVQEYPNEVFDAIENFACEVDHDFDLDTIEELLYNESTEDLIEMFGLTPIESDED